MSKRNLELKSRDWRKPRESRELSPEKLFSILASVDGEKRAIEKMIDLGCDSGQSWCDLSYKKVRKVL